MDISRAPNLWYLQGCRIFMTEGAKSYAEETTAKNKIKPTKIVIASLDGQPYANTKDLNKNKNTKGG